MSRFPAQICVKRKANEEPVEALYLQTERQPKRALTEIAYRLWTEKRSASNRTRGVKNEQIQTPQVPTIRTSHPDEDESQSHTQVSAELRQDQIVQPLPPIHSALYGSAQVSQRVFHLSRAQADLPSVSGLDSPGSQKRKRATKLATFVEGPRLIKKARSILDLTGTARAVDNSSKDQHLETTNVLATEQTTQPPKLSQRKRPGASAAERKWRSETWARKVADADATPDIRGSKENTADSKDDIWAESSLKLAQELHEFGLQETRLESSNAANQQQQQQQQPGPKSPTKHRPKVPAQRYADRHPKGEIEGEVAAAEAPTESHDSQAPADEGEDYVMDVYVIEPEAQNQVTTSRENGGLPSSPLHKFALPPPESIGIIVIAEDEEEIWREFAELDTDDQEGDSEDEDENAEDFYANDYPEDELDSDDEFGRNPYKFRANRSDPDDSDKDRNGDDDEDDDDAWSESDFRHHPWARHAWEVRS